MALGSKLGSKGALSNGQAALMAELEKEMKSEEVEVADAWDDDAPEETGGDLMDVNADQDDWSEYQGSILKLVINRYPYSGIRKCTNYIGSG